MAVTQVCQINNDAVGLNLAKGQKLQYRIGHTGVLYQLHDQAGKTLLPGKDDETPAVRIWPADATEIPADDDVTHPLGIQFGETGRVTWEIELVAADGTTLQVVKDCIYGNDGGTDDYFDALRIFITAR